MRDGRGPRLHPMTTGPDLEAAAADYDRVLGRELKDEPLDLAILGVGEDGHIGGLFTGHPALDELTRVVGRARCAPPAVSAADAVAVVPREHRDIWVVALGERKRALVQAAVRRQLREYSAGSCLLRHAPRVTIYTDQIVQRR